MFPLTLVQKQELNFHLIGSLNEYFKFPFLATIAKLRQCEFGRLRGFIFNILEAKKEL